MSVGIWDILYTIPYWTIHHLVPINSAIPNVLMGNANNST